MRGLSLVPWAAALLVLAVSCGGQRSSALSSSQRAELLPWLEEHGRPPEEYVVSKFADHDVVFLGEYHRIRHDVVLVQRLIPYLDRAGVRNLGLEFLLASDQPLIDSLLAGATYDEGLARRLFWDQWPWWGYQEYVDILRAAWDLNHSRARGAPPFRVLGLNSRGDWSRVWKQGDLDDPEIRRSVRPEGSSDSVMAATIQREVLAKGEKALVYSGIYHAITRFRQPSDPDSTGRPRSFASQRMGNRIQAQIGDRCFLIFLHSPWPGAGGYSDAEVHPVDGVLDGLFAALPSGKRRMGFDVAGSPLGRLPGRASYWGHAIPDFRAEMFCDGWIYQKPLREYEGVHVVPGWFNEGNRLDAIAQIANPDPRVKSCARTVAQLTESLASDTRIRSRFARLR